jgi:hypothetical protein
MVIFDGYVIYLVFGEKSMWIWLLRSGVKE